MGSLPDRQALAEVVEVPDPNSGGAGSITSPFFPPSDYPFTSGEDTTSLDTNPVEIDLPIPAGLNRMWVVQVMMLMAIGDSGTPLTGGVSASLFLATCYRDSTGVLRAPAASALMSSLSGEPAIVSVTPQLLLPDTFRIRMEATNLGHCQIGYRYTAYELALAFEIPTPGS